MKTLPTVGAALDELEIRSADMDRTVSDLSCMRKGRVPAHARGAALTIERMQHTPNRLIQHFGDSIGGRHENLPDPQPQVSSPGNRKPLN